MRLTNAREGNAVELKTYQAYTMAEALAAVKRDLGADAVILHTRSFQRGGVLGLGQKTIVEVTARTNSEVFTSRTSTPKPKPIAAGHRAYLQPPARSEQTEPPALAAARKQERDHERTRRLAQALVEKHERERQSENPPPAQPPVRSPNQNLVRDFPVVSPPTPPATPLRVSDPAPATTTAEPVAKRFVLTPHQREELEPVPALPSSRDHEAGGIDRMQDDLNAIRSMVGQVLQKQVINSDSSDPDLPEHLFDLYLTLIAQDLSRDLAERISREVRNELGEDNLEDAEVVRRAVLKSLAAHIPCADQPVAEESPDGRPLTVALVGPTGVGKTTTLAKLAATFKLREGKRVGVITADTYRIAAVDQLRTYTNIIGLPLQVALTPGEMRQAVHQLSDCDVILIDTAGRSQNDAERLAELKLFLDAADPHEVHLVLSTTADQKVLLREAEAFAAVGVDKVVLTKLDEAVNFGMIVNVINLVGKELSFFTTGQEVPDHLERSRPERLAELILGEGVHA